MKTRTMIAALLGLPLLIGACNKPPAQSQTSSIPDADKPAVASTPSAQDKMMQNAPPAAGAPAPGTADTGSAMPSTPATPGAMPPADNTSNPPASTGKGY